MKLANLTMKQLRDTISELRARHKPVPRTIKVSRKEWDEFTKELEDAGMTFHADANINRLALYGVQVEIIEEEGYGEIGFRPA